MLSKIEKALRHPRQTYYHFYGKYFPEKLMSRYADLSKSQGIDQLYMVLSFDCDTDNDIAVAWDVHARLMDLGVMPVYAVPGDFLRKGEKVYGQIAQTGAQFINHGDIEHTYFDTEKGRHASCFFYDQQTFERLRKDILDGHQTLKDVLGLEVNGYRTPHFGTFQNAEQLAFLYGVLRELKYTFSTSTTPYKGLVNGACYDVGGLKEFPVSGMMSSPQSILDTWAFFEAPDRVRKPREYVEEAERLADVLVKNRYGIINIYGDPSHIHGHSEFFEAVAALSKVAKVASYNDILGLT